MSSPHLPIDEFFLRLAALFDARGGEGHGSVFLTQKRLSHLPTTTSTSTTTTASASPITDLHPPTPLPVLVRATNGKRKDARADKIKLSTVVQPDELEAFYARYAEVFKAKMQGLKKRDRSGRKKAKARKRKGGEGERKA